MFLRTAINKTQLKITSLHQLASTLGSMHALLSNLEAGSRAHTALTQRIDAVNNIADSLKDKMTPEEIDMANANIEHEAATKGLLAANGLNGNEKIPAETFFKFKELADVEGKIFYSEQRSGMPGDVELLKNKARELFEQLRPEEQRLFQATKQQSIVEAALIDSQSK